MSEKIITITWKLNREMRTTILAIVDSEGRLFWNRSHMAIPHENWRQDTAEISDSQLVDYTRRAGEFLGRGELAQEAADLLLDKLNAESLRRHVKQDKPAPKRRKLSEATTIPAPPITNAEAAQNLSKGERG